MQSLYFCDVHEKHRTLGDATESAYMVSPKKKRRRRRGRGKNKIQLGLEVNYDYHATDREWVEFYQTFPLSQHTAVNNAASRASPDSDATAVHPLAYSWGYTNLRPDSYYSDPNMKIEPKGDVPGPRDGFYGELRGTPGSYASPYSDIDTISSDTASDSVGQVFEGFANIYGGAGPAMSDVDDGGIQDSAGITPFDLCLACVAVADSSSGDANIPGVGCTKSLLNPRASIVSFASTSDFTSSTSTPPASDVPGPSTISPSAIPTFETLALRIHTNIHQFQRLHSTG